ncbi:MAG: pentapeptide repeat-containing protein [Pleurocapsa sp. MO_226.B13]|nr:pentapeptide repeat-containing protein [Pleurocapsa sp. MO_226.B13]
MVINIGNSWQNFWQQNRPELDNVLEAGEFTANTTAAGLGLAIALGVANPAVGVAAAGLAFAGSARKVIEFVAKKGDKTLTLEEVVAIAAPLAYVKSFKSWIERNSILAEKISPEQNQETQVDSRIENLTLDRELATNALRNFHRSELAQTFNQILSSRLDNKGLSQTEVEIIVSWVAWETGRYLKEEVEETSDSQNLLDFNIFNILNIYSNASQQDDSSPYKSIETYLKKQIESQPQEKVFNEEFSFADIYVPLKAAPVDANGKVNENAESFVVVENWAEEMLLNPQKGKQVMFIQGGPGRGKTVFCRMFADWVRQEIHPLWIPILIRLRDIASFEQSFEKTLQGAVNADFARDDGWLTDSKLRFLFLLDGFDELRMEGRARGGIERFIKQAGSFQERCDTSEMGHRFIVTGRQLALQGISYLPDNLERVELLAMDDILQEQWLGEWEKVVDKDTNIAQEKTVAFKAFLQSDSLPQEVKKDLAREPLLLYLLAAMHRDGDIKVEDLEGKSGIQTKITIYEQALNWVLTKQRKDKDKDVQKEIVRLETEQLRQVLMEAGLSVVQSGGECARVKTIEQRLIKSKPKIAIKIQQIRATQGDKVLKNALAAFYLKPASTSEDDEGAVEFFHKSFGEFLCAKRMQQSLERWTRWDDDEDEFYLNKKQLAEEIYDLLGYGSLTPEIVEYLFGLLAVSNKFTPVKLFNRLEDFYLRWCDGKFIDAPPDNNYPQQKMRLLKEQKPETINKQDILGLRQVDVYTGLNVMILLLELHRYAQQQEKLKEVINFHPCGKRNQEGKLEDSTRLFRIIGYSRCLSDFGFIDTVDRFLSDANLSRADLSRADLSRADLSGADLSRADLRGADLSRADLSRADLSRAHLIGANLSRADLSGAYLIEAYLSGADLRGAYLSGADLSRADLSSGADLREANLSRADLSRADLSGAYLSGADLRGADLRGADLSGADLSEANLEGIRWDKNTNWSNVRGLESAINVPEALKQQLLQ